MLNPCKHCGERHYETMDERECLETKIGKLRAERDAALLQIERYQKALSAIQSHGSSEPGVLRAIAFNAINNPDVFVGEPKDEPLCGCGCHGSNWGQATACGCCAYPTMRPQEMKEAKNRSCDHLFVDYQCEKCGIPEKLH